MLLQTEGNRCFDLGSEERRPFHDSARRTRVQRESLECLWISSRLSGPRGQVKRDAHKTKSLFCTPRVGFPQDTPSYRLRSAPALFLRLSWENLNTNLNPPLSFSSYLCTAPCPCPRRRTDRTYEELAAAVRSGAVGAVRSVHAIFRDHPVPSIDFLKQVRVRTHSPPAPLLPRGRWSWSCGLRRN